MGVTHQRQPGRHTLENANADRPKFQRGKKIRVKDVVKKRRRRKK